MTSNLGSPYILDGITSDGEISDTAREQVDALLKQSFRPEFLNRLDEIVYYKPLGKAEISKIVDLMIKSLDKRLAEKQLSVRLTDAAKEYIIENGYDPIYGARPLARFIQRKAETLIARAIIGDKLHSGDVITIDADEGGLYLK